MVNDTDIIDTLTDLCRLLSSAPLTVDDVERQVAELEVEATVHAEPGTDEPAFVHVKVPETSQVTLDALCETFGPYRQLPRPQRNAPVPYMFRVDRPDAPYTCAVVARKRPEQSRIEAVDLRRDVRLE